jgi:hypothetical protein
MKMPEAREGQTVVATACWSCGVNLYKTVPLLRRGSGHVRWACDDCDVAWSEPVQNMPEAA